MRQVTDREGGRGKKEGYFTRLSRVIRMVIGAPDYDVYLEHCRHAGHPPRLSETEFVRQYFEDKGRRPRCC